MPLDVAVIDYGLGNIRSVVGAIERVGHSARAVDDPGRLGEPDRLILPGVGAFRDGMRRLTERNWPDALADSVIHGATPILGICLGAQLMANRSSEFGETEGLGWIDGSVERIVPSDDGLRVPHVGWNACMTTTEHPMFRDLDEEMLFYFVHSYHIVPAQPGIITATTDHGGPITAAFARENIWGTQFHPEKSQRAGLTILKNFLEGPAC